MTDEEKKYEREQWKKMKPRQKITHFLEYYLIQTLAVLGSAVFVIVLIATMIRPEEKNALSVYVYDDVLEPSRTEEFCGELRKAMGITDRHETVSVFSGYDKDAIQDIMTLQVHQAAGDVDLIISDEETFRYFAGTGYLIPIEELGEDITDKYGDRIVQAAGPGKENENGELLAPDGTGTGDTADYGLRITGSKVWEELSLSGRSDFIAGLAAGSDNPENAALFFDTLLS